FDMGYGTWAAVMGDVCGKGPRAAALTGLARHTIRAAALKERRPSQVLHTLNEAIRRHAERDDAFCTVCCCVLRPSALGLRVRVACGGHPLPLLVRSDGSVEPVGRTGTLLGLFAEPELVDQVLDVRRG